MKFIKRTHQLRNEVLLWQWQDKDYDRHMHKVQSELQSTLGPG